MLKNGAVAWLQSLLGQQLSGSERDFLKGINMREIPAHHWIKLGFVPMQRGGAMKASQPLSGQLAGNLWRMRD